MDNNRNIYITRSDRQARQLYFNYNNTRNTRDEGNRPNIMTNEEEQQVNEF